MTEGLVNPMLESKLIFLTLLHIRGIGRKSLTDISKERLCLVQNLQSLYELYQELRENNARIEAIDLSELECYFKIAEKIFKAHAQAGITIIDRFDEEYPQSFNLLKLPPVLLYAKGNLSCLHKKCITIIGTRHISTQGQEMAALAGKVAVNKDFTVVSGLAIGCDTAAHKACLDNKGLTVAILGNGLDTIYPAANKGLADRILASEGCLLSEFPMGVKATAYNLVDRDRLQAALSYGTIVIEAGIKSGTMNAVQETLREHKPLAFFEYNEEHYKKHTDSSANKEYLSQEKASGLNNYDSVEDFLERCQAIPCAIEQSLF